MNRVLKYGIGLLVLFLVTYSSVYFRKLDKMKATSKDFNETVFARDYFDNTLLPALNNTIDLDHLFTLLQKDRKQTFKKYSRAAAVGNNRYFPVKGTGKVLKIDEDNVLLLMKNSPDHNSVFLATDLVFGNALRDVTGKIHIDSFPSIMDFNSVSSAINKIVRTEVLPSFKDSVTEGDVVQFAGAIKLNKAHLNTEDPIVIPAWLKIIHKK